MHKINTKQTKYKYEIKYKNKALWNRTKRNKTKDKYKT